MSWRGHFWPLHLTLIGHDGGSASLSLRMVALAVYLFLMIVVVRPLAAWLVKRMRTTTDLPLKMLGVVVALTLCSAAATDGLFAASG